MAFNLKLGSLMVTIEGDSKGLDEASKKSQKSLDDLAKKSVENAAALGKWAGAAVAAASVAAGAIIKSSLSSINELNSLARIAGLTVEEFQKGAFAAKQYGIEQDKFADIIKDVNDKMGAFIATGSGPMKDFFEKIGPKVGVTVDNFRKLSGPDALQLYVKSLEQAGVNQKEMTFYMEGLAGDASKLLPLLRDNGKAMGEAAKRADELGVGLSQIDVQRAIEAERALAGVGAAIDSQVKKAAVELAPYITAIADEVGNFIAESGGISSFVVPAFEKLAWVVGVFADGIHGVKIIFKGLEIVARGVIAGVATGLNWLVKGATELGNSIIDGIVYPLRKALEIAAQFSDSAKEALAAFEATVDSLKLTGIQGVEDFANASIEAIEMAKGEMHDMLMSPLPSQKIEEFIEGVKNKAKAAAPDIAKSLTGGTVDTAGVGGGFEEQPADIDTGPTPAEEYRQQQQELYDAMIEEGLRKEETMAMQFERERMVLEDGLRNKYLTEEQYSMLSRQLAEDEAAFKTDVMLSAMDAVVEAVSIGGKKANKVQQKLAILNAVIHGKEAAVAAWRAGMSTGGPWAPAVAAAYTAASIARTASMINSIKSGGSSVSGGGGGGGGGFAAQSGGAGGAGGGDGGQSQASAPRFINVNFTGQGLLNTAQVRELMGQINEQLGDGVKLNVTGA